MEKGDAVQPGQGRVRLQSAERSIVGTQNCPGFAVWSAACSAHQAFVGVDDAVEDFLSQEGHTHLIGGPGKASWRADVHALGFWWQRRLLRR